MKTDPLVESHAPPAAVDAVAVRPCRLHDVEALALVAAATCLETFAGILPGPDLIQHCARHHTASAYAGYLAEPRTRAWLAVTCNGDAPVGYSLLTRPDLPLSDLSSRDLELKRIYLFSRFQGTGVGQQLMQVAIDAARDAAAERLLLGVYARNLRALRFYERNGFTKVGVRTFTVGSLVCDDFILGRPL